jgi:hypothetical protein
VGTSLNMRTRKMCWDVMTYCAFCAQNCYYSIVFSFRVNILRFTKRNLKKANWNIFVNKTNFPTVSVNGVNYFLYIAIYTSATGMYILF